MPYFGFNWVGVDWVVIAALGQAREPAGGVAVVLVVAHLPRQQAQLSFRSFLLGMASGHGANSPLGVWRLGQLVHGEDLVEHCAANGLQTRPGRGCVGT